jgi:hypothetical protein
MKIESTWVPYLIRDGESGIYYARLKIGGKIKLRFLETDKITTVKIRLSDKLDAIRKSIPSAPEEGISLEPNATFNDAFKKLPELPARAEFTQIIQHIILLSKSLRN